MSILQDMPDVEFRIGTRTRLLASPYFLRVNPLVPVSHPRDVIYARLLFRLIKRANKIYNVARLLEVVKAVPLIWHSKKNGSVYRHQIAQIIEPTNRVRNVLNHMISDYNIEDFINEFGWPGSFDHKVHVSDHVESATGVVRVIAPQFVSSEIVCVFYEDAILSDHGRVVKRPDFEIASAQVGGYELAAMPCRPS